MNTIPTTSRQHRPNLPKLSGWTEVCLMNFWTVPSTAAGMKSGDIATDFEAIRSRQGGRPTSISP